ncbi:MAG TPA: hypothetical protein VFV13_05630 [Acidimicrobiia bacterium]|nr:hypothetical protein [Acidimicrobiia bacterium]
MAEMLGRHPSISWDGEVFEPKVRAKIGYEDVPPVAFLRDRIARAPEIYGFEIKYLPSHHQRVLGLDLEGILQLTDSVGVSLYVTLHRRNYLRRVVSGVIGRERRRWHRTSDQPTPDTKVRVDLGAVPFGPRQPLLEVLEEMKKGEADLKSALLDRAALHLTYEDDVAIDPVKAYTSVCEFIGITPEDVRPALGRTGTDRLESMVTNYDEIVEALSGTEYAWMLD